MDSTINPQLLERIDAWYSPLIERGYTSAVAAKATAAAFQAILKADPTAAEGLPSLVRIMHPIVQHGKAKNHFAKTIPDIEEMITEYQKLLHPAVAAEYLKPAIEGHEKLCRFTDKLELKAVPNYKILTDADITQAFRSIFLGPEAYTQLHNAFAEFSLSVGERMLGKKIPDEEHRSLKLSVIAIKAAQPYFSELLFRD